MKQLSVELTPLALRLKSAVRTAQGEISLVRGVRVRVEGEGAVGLGEATPVPGRDGASVERTAAALERCRAGVPMPEAVTEIDAVVGRLPEDAPAARCGLELALLDHLARRRGVPVAKLLSPSAHDEVLVNAVLPENSGRALAEAAAAAVQDGFRTLKLKVAGRPLDEDLRRLRAVRERVGPAIRIRVDANGAWTEPLARAALEAMVAFDVELCEQPVLAAELEVLERLAATSRCRVAADEAVPALLREDRPSAVLLWVLKPAALGGLLPCLRAAERGRARGVESYVTAGWDGRVARMGALHLAAALPPGDRAHGLSTGRWMPAAEAEPVPHQGKLVVSSVPGLGLSEVAE